MESRGEKTLKAASEGFKYFFLLNLFSKMLTFGANTMVVRYTSPTEMGVKLNMELACNAILFFSREALRTAALRLEVGNSVTPETGKDNLIYTINAGWISFLVTCVLVAGVYTIGLPFLLGKSEWADISEELSIPGVLGLHLLGCVLESLAEPLYMATQNIYAVNKIRVNMDVSGLVVKTLTTVGLVMFGYPSLLAIALAQCEYGIVAIVWYYGWYSFSKQKFSLFPKFHKNTFLPKSVRGVINQLYLESIMRLILTEGEKILLSSVTALAAQGVYEVVANLGSIVVRILFKFLEETSLVVWTKLMNADGLVQAETLLKLLLRLLTIIGLVFACWGPAYSQTLLFILYGTRWVGEASGLMSIYCVYVSLMGVNGVCEAFYRSAATGSKLQLLWKMQAVFSGLFVVLALSLAQTMPSSVGIHCVVASSAVVMVLRIAFCLRFASATLPSFTPSACLPSHSITLFALGSLVVTTVSQSILLPSNTHFSLQNMGLHVGLGAGLGLVFIYLVYKKERAVLMEVRRLLGK
eukprot:TRINITY_DN4368_c0_g2_i1.p1 TRINITY_DN4368_c0_g2~~TRINITY_DN4368_c0_g2_i1.p1  ORF type:complete len:541 (+),score=62.72 TRINITY_DN4368_c0_g2_i1:51-1625(+)